MQLAETAYRLARGITVRPSARRIRAGVDGSEGNLWADDAAALALEDTDGRIDIVSEIGPPCRQWCCRHGDWRGENEKEE